MSYSETLSRTSASQNPLQTTKIGTLTFLTNIGSGGFGTVFACYSTKLQKILACKRIARDNRFSIERFTSEFDTWLLASKNDFLVDLIDVTYDKNHVYFVQELLFGGTLKPRENVYTFAQKHEITSQISLALEFLHKNQIAHLDIKPENILIHSFRPKIYVKLHDFGISRHKNSGENSKVGTLAYMAPEMLTHKSDQIDYFYCDFYSLGITIFELYMTRLPKGKIGSTDEILKKWGEKVEVVSEKFASVEIIQLVKKLTSEKERKTAFDEFVGTKVVICKDQVIDYKQFLEKHFQAQHIYVYLNVKLREDGREKLEQVAKALSLQKNYEFRMAIEHYEGSIGWFLELSRKSTDKELVSVLKQFLNKALSQAEECKKFIKTYQKPEKPQNPKNCTIT